MGYGAVATRLDCVLHQVVESVHDHVGQLVVVERQVTSGVDLEDYGGIGIWYEVVGR